MPADLILPTHPILRPGLLVARRDDGHLQVGLDRAVAVVVPDDAETRAALTALRHGSRPAAAALETPWWERLVAAGLVVDADQLVTDLPDSAAGARAIAAAYVQGGLRARELLAQRAARAVRVVGPATEVGWAAGLLELCGVPRGETPYACLVISRGELDREDL